VKTSQDQDNVPKVVQEKVNKQASTFKDERPETVAQGKLYDMVNNSQQVTQMQSLQSMVDNRVQNSPFDPIQRKENNTGLPDNLKSGVENLSGHSMDDVKVHYNSPKPAQLQAHAYAQGTDIHVASGQEKHLPHEAWHVVQQKQGRVKPTMQMKGKVNVNDDSGLEREADVMGGKALQLKTNENNPLEQISVANVVAQRVSGDAEKENDRMQYLESWSEKAEAFVWSEDGKLYKGVQGGEKVEVATSDDRNFKTEKDNNSDAIVANHDLIEGAENIDKLEPSIIKNLVPKGSKLRDVMQNSCYESWEFMTHELNKLGEIPEAEENKEKKNNRKTLLRKIWEYRQWHHDFILKQTQSKIGKENLSSWASAGSTTLTSDIDINLKGDNTELAVKEFNTLFKADGWKYEAGTVYDVNVYALDFMHAGYVFGKGEKVQEGGFEMVMDIHGNLLKKKNAQDETVEDNTTGRTKKTGKEGSKKGQAEGGFSGESQDVILKDSVNQEVWTYVKARLYMKTSEWNTFAENIDLKDDIKREVEAKYATYVQNMKAKIGDAASEENELETGIQSLIANAKKVAEKGGAEGHQLDVETSQLMIGGSNRIYEEKLVPIHALRKKLKKVIDKYNAALNAQQMDKLANLNRLIDMNLLELRNLVSEATIYSNEAYLTDGAVNHAVVGIQSNKSIELTNNETLHALIENMADSLKEIARHGATLGEAAFKAGKYMFRLADAAMNMGYKTKEMTKLYEAGDVISNDIKKNVEDSEEQKTQSAVAVGTHLNVRESSVNLAAKVRELATKAIKWKQSKGEAFGMNKSAAVGSNKG
jgi:hypothetical protein